MPNWFGPGTALICQPPTLQAVLNKFPNFRVEQTLVEDMPRNDFGTTRLLSKISNALPQHLPLMGEPASQTTSRGGGAG